jgi:hypothetical protein
MDRRSRVRSLFLFLLLSLSALWLGQPLSARSRTAVAYTSGRDYLSALATANRFLHAWQSQDRETGLLMLSDNAKRGVPEDRLQSFLSPGPDAAYEIGRGRKLQTGGYAFPVVLLGVRGDGKTIRSHASELVVILTGKDDWAIEKLPFNKLP